MVPVGCPSKKGEFGIGLDVSCSSKHLFFFSNVSHPYIKGGFLNLWTLAASLKKGRFVILFLLAALISKANHCFWYMSAAALLKHYISKPISWPELSEWGIYYFELTWPPFIMSILFRVAAGRFSFPKGYYARQF